MTDYRAVMDLVLKDWSVRQIRATVRCSHSTVQKTHDGECPIVCVRGLVYK